MGHQGGSLEQVWGPLVYGAAKMLGFGIGQDFLTQAVAPGTARRALACLASKQKPEGEATWKVPRRGGQWSAPGASKGEPLALTGHRTLLCCGAPRG